MTRDSWLGRINDARLQTDALFDLLQPHSLFERPVAERHRLIFYLGHLEAFDWNHIAVRGLSQARFHPSFDQLFEAGIDPEPGTGLPADEPEDWPALEEVGRYRRQVRQAIDRLLPSAQPQDIQMALEHRLMHAETLAYLLHNLPLELKHKPTGIAQPDYRGNSRNTSLVIPEGVATVGKGREDGFGWDNEFDQHQTRVPAFEIDRFKVSNGEYLEFVRQGGQVPFLWRNIGGSWFFRGMFELIPLPLDWPAWVTQDQASAYARWAGKTLPTEAQFHRAAYARKDGTESCYPWGDASPQPHRGNFDFNCWDPGPVNAWSSGSSDYGVAQLLGNGWEWTRTLFEPFPGFVPMPGYEGYSANFFDGKHYVLKGASPRTAACFLRRSFRNWFRPNYPYVYAGFRCVRS